LKKNLSTLEVKFGFLDRAFFFLLIHLKKEKHFTRGVYCFPSENIGTLFRELAIHVEKW